MDFFIYPHEQWHSGFPRHINEGMKLERTEQVYGATLSHLMDWMRVETCDLLLINAEGGEILAMEQLCTNAKLRERVTQFCTSGHFQHVHIYPKEVWDNLITRLSQWYTISQRVAVPEIPYYLWTRKNGIAK